MVSRLQEQRVYSKYQQIVQIYLERVCAIRVQFGFSTSSATITAHHPCLRGGCNRQAPFYDKIKFGHPHPAHKPIVIAITKITIKTINSWRHKVEND
jgi:hypothetical protein